LQLPLNGWRHTHSATTSTMLLTHLGYFSAMSLQLADKLVGCRVIDAAGSVCRRRQQVLTGEVKPNVENFVFMARQRPQTPAWVYTTTAQKCTPHLSVHHNQQHTHMAPWCTPLLVISGLDESYKTSIQITIVFFLSHSLAKLPCTFQDCISEKLMIDGDGVIKRHVKNLLCSRLLEEERIILYKTMT